MSGNDPTWLQTLRAAYITRLPQRLAALRRAVDRCGDGAEHPRHELLVLVHHLHGSTGTYGLGDAAALLESWEAELTAGRLDTSEARLGALHNSLGIVAEDGST